MKKGPKPTQDFAIQLNALQRQFEEKFGVQEKKFEAQEKKFEAQEKKSEEKEQRLEAQVASLQGRIAGHRENLDELNRVRGQPNQYKYLYQTYPVLLKLVNLLTPLHLRVLLDVARKKILTGCGYDDWETLRAQKHARAPGVHL